MVRIKNTPTKINKHAKSLLKKASAAIGKKSAKKGEGAAAGGGLIHTGKLKVPFKPASGAGGGKGTYTKVKKGLVKLIKRRWRSGTVAKREIRKLSKTTHHLFPKRPFNRLVRELSQDIKSDVRFTKESMHAIQECAEMFVCCMFMKSDIARNFAGRKTLLAKDVKFAGFMRDECIWQFPSAGPSLSASLSSGSSSTATASQKQHLPRLKLTVNPPAAKPTKPAAAAASESAAETPAVEATAASSSAAAPAAEAPAAEDGKKGASSKASGKKKASSATPDEAAAPPPAAKKAKSSSSAAPAAALAAQQQQEEEESSSSSDDEDGSSSSSEEDAATEDAKK